MDLGKQLTGIFKPLLSRSFDPELGWKNLQRLIDSLEQRENKEENLFTRFPPSVHPELAALLSGSPYLFQIFLENLDYFQKEASTKGSLTYSLSRQGLEAAYRLHLTRSVSREQAPFNANKDHSSGKQREFSAHNLKTFKNCQILRIGLADLTKSLETARVIEELSELASFCLEAVYRAGLNQLIKRYGRPVYLADDGEIASCSFTVIGMGKLGGEELNFSSDIDIIFIYDPDIGKTEGPKILTGKPINQVSNFEFYSQLATYITNTLHKNQIYRVDLGLRPEGKSGSAAISLAAAELYYESWGQPWERQALIKARPCAGDLKLGRKFLETLHPFIYRKSLDFSAISEIKKMKLLIDGQPRSNAKKTGIDVKLGSGGIRELEFIVQSFQLVYGGKKLKLQGQKTMPVLEEITAEKLLPPDEHKVLNRAYLFLRDLENRIQMFQGRQTQTLPQDPQILDALARKMNFSSSDENSAGECLMGQYRCHSEQVSRIYRQIFHQESAGDGRPEKPAAYRREQLDIALEKAGFKDIDKVKKDFHRLRYGRSFTEVGNRRQILFDKICPLILDICRDLPDPDNAVVNFEKFVFSYGAGKDLYSLCYIEGKLLRLLLGLFGNSEFLSQILIRMPELFESLFAFYEPESAKTIKEMKTEIWNVTNLPSEDQQIEALVKYVRSEELRIGTRYLTGKTEASFGELTDLAEAYLQKIFEICYRQLESRYGTPTFTGPGSRKKSRFAVIGFGKLGGREIDFGSDLDLIFVYEADGETSPVNGPARSIDNRFFFTKLSQLIVKAIKHYTRFGLSYQLDLDIRPEGKQGNLAVMLDQLKGYYKNRAQLWEFQALLKARPVAGDHGLFGSFNNVRKRVLTGNRFSQEEISLQIEEMLEKIRDERASKQVEFKDLKLGAGGMIEIEFLAQELQLKFGREKPQLYASNTLDALKLLLESGLIGVEQYRSLKKAYNFLREVISRERLIKGKPCNTISCSHDQLEVLAKRLNYPAGNNCSPGEVLYNVFFKHTRQVVDICNEIKLLNVNKT